MAKILIVEDDSTSRLILEKILCANGFEVVKASSAKSALELLTKNLNPALIISDIMMPVMDGIEFAKRLKDDPELGKIPVIMSTALHDKHTVLEAAKLGVQHFVIKPIDAEKLIQAVNQVLSGNDPLT